MVGVPRKVRLHAIKYHHLALRADEEVDLINSEMLSMFRFFLKDWTQLSTAAEDYSTKPPSKYNNGALGQLKQACIKCENLLFTLQSTFSTYVDLPPLPVDKFLSTRPEISAPVVVNSSSTDSDCDQETSITGEFYMYVCILL